MQILFKWEQIDFIYAKKGDQENCCHNGVIQHLQWDDDSLIWSTVRIAAAMLHEGQPGLNLVSSLFPLGHQIFSSSSSKHGDRKLL